MIEMATLWCYGHPWVVNAACDLATLGACLGVVTLTLRRKIEEAAAVIAPSQPDAVSEPESLDALKPRLPEAKPRPNRVRKLVRQTEHELLPVDKQQAVNQALAAMSRWEATYRTTGRGLPDLSRLAYQSANRVQRAEVGAD